MSSLLSGLAVLPSLDTPHILDSSPVLPHTSCLRALQSLPFAFLPRCRRFLIQYDLESRAILDRYTANRAASCCILDNGAHSSCWPVPHAAPLTPSGNNAPLLPLPYPPLCPGRSFLCDLFLRMLPHRSLCLWNTFLRHLLLLGRFHLESTPFEFLLPKKLRLIEVGSSANALIPRGAFGGGFGLSALACATLIVTCFSPSD